MRSGSDHRLTLAWLLLSRPTSASGMATTASFSSSRATRIAAWPAATTWPGSIGGGRDDAVGIGAQAGIGECVPGQRHGALRAQDAAVGLVGRRALLFEVGVGGPALLAQHLAAPQVGLRLHLVAFRGLQLRLRLVELEPEIDFIERGEHLTRLHRFADLDQAAAQPCRRPGSRGRFRCAGARWRRSCVRARPARSGPAAQGPGASRACPSPPTCLRCRPPAPVSGSGAENRAKRMSLSSKRDQGRSERTISAAARRASLSAFSWLFWAIMAGWQRPTHSRNTPSAVSTGSSLANSPLAMPSAMTVA